MVRLSSLFGVIVSASLAAAVEGLPSDYSSHNRLLERATVPPLRSSIYTPPGSVLKDFTIGSAKAAVFWTAASTAKTATTAYIVQHGRLRDGGDYWQLLNSTLSSAIASGVPGVSQNAIIVAPQMFAKTDDKGKYTSSELAWSTDGWSGGAVASHPTGTSLSSLDVLDALVAEFNNVKKYPKLQKIIALGHGGGGQLMQRFAVVGQNSALPMRLVVGNPSSALYFDKTRPASSSAIGACRTFNTFRYGFDGFSGTTAGLLAVQDYFTQYARREVVNIVGYLDTSNGGDQSCGANVQGGKYRRDRNLAWWKYINTLAGTSDDVSGFPGNFSAPIPNWSSLTGGVLNHRLVVVSDSTHNAVSVFASKEGQSALFGLSSADILQGWRPGSNVTSSTTVASSTTSSVAPTASSDTSTPTPTSVDPGATSTDPGSSSTDPGTTSTDPGTTSTDPGTTSSPTPTPTDSVPTDTSSPTSTFSIDDSYRRSI